ncbi:MAG: MFS transporter [Planctomycetota bacterium]|nr:MFS transporter [Planctomycetota bacterium]
MESSGKGGEGPSQAPGGLKLVLRSLNHRNFRLFFGGQGLSLIGTLMQQAALGFLVFRLTKSKELLGLVAFAGQIPVFLVASFAGVLGDRWDRKKVLVVTQALSMLQAAGMAAVAMAPETGAAWWALSVQTKIGCMIALSVMLGLINGFDMPIRQAFIVDMVDRKEDLPNAIALNSTLFNVARVIGPAVGGYLVAAVGEGGCFVVNAASYVAVLWALLAMQVAARPRPTQQRHVLHSLKEGFRYVKAPGPIRSLLLLLAVVTLFGAPYGALMPAFADGLGAGPREYGWLLSSAGAGALLGAVFLAARRSVIGLAWWIAVTPALLGLALVTLAISPSLWVAMAALVVVGFAYMMQIGSTNTILQTIVDHDKRSRVMSFHTMAFMGAAPVGALAAGFLSKKIGLTATVVGGGCVCLAASAVFLSRLGALRRVLRPIYVRMGILAVENEAVALGANGHDKNRRTDA